MSSVFHGSLPFFKEVMRGCGPGSRNPICHLNHQWTCSKLPMPDCIPDPPTQSLEAEAHVATGVLLFKAPQGNPLKTEKAPESALQTGKFCSDGRDSSHSLRLPVSAVHGVVAVSYLPCQIIRCI